MAFRFTTVAIAILLIGGGIAAAVAIGDDPAAPISRDDRPNQIEKDLDAALRQDDDAEQDDAVEDAGDDTTGDTNSKNDTNDDSEGGGDSGGHGSGGSGED